MMVTSTTAWGREACKQDHRQFKQDELENYPEVPRILGFRLRSHEIPVLAVSAAKNHLFKESRY